MTEIPLSFILTDQELYELRIETAAVSPKMGTKSLNSSAQNVTHANTAGPGTAGNEIGVNGMLLFPALRATSIFIKRIYIPTI